MPPINPHITPRHPRTPLRHQKHRHPPKIRHPPQPPQHILPWPLHPPLREPLQQALHHLRRNVPGTDRINADPPLAPLGRQAAAQLLHGGLAGVVRRAAQPAVRDAAGHAGDERDAAAAHAVRQHRARHRLRRRQHARHVDRQQRRARVRGEVERRVLVLDAGRRDEAVDAAVRGGDGGDERVQRGRVGHVDRVVGERRVQGEGFGLDALEGGAGGGEAVEGVDCGGVSGGREGEMWEGGWGKGGVPVAPHSRRASAWARPRPRAAPVTTMTFPARLKRDGVVVSNVESDAEADAAVDSVTIVAAGISAADFFGSSRLGHARVVVKKGGG